MFRYRCIESNNLLAEFHKLNSMQTIQSEQHQQQQFNNSVQIVSSHIQNDILFGIDGMLMFPEQISEKMLPVFDSDLLKLEQNVMLDDEIRRHDFQNSCAVEAMSTPIQMNSDMMPVEYHIIKEEHQDQVVQLEEVKVKVIEVIELAQTTETIETSTEPKRHPKRKPQKAEQLNDVNLCVKNLLQKDIKASLQKNNSRIDKKSTATKRNDRQKSDDNQFVSELCEQCGLTFSNSNEYKKHIRNHEDKGESKTTKRNRENVSISDGSSIGFRLHLFHLNYQLKNFL